MRIPAFRDRFNAYVANHFPGGAPAQLLTLDAEVPLSAITFGLMNDLDKLEPYGAGNSRPKFLASGLKAEAARLIGTGGTTMIRGDQLQSALGAYDRWMTFTKVVDGRAPPPQGGGPAGGVPQPSG